MADLTKGSEIELEVERLVFGGRGLARVNGFVVFIDRAIPGQHVLARITRKKSSYAEAKAVQILQDAPNAVSPRCAHFGTCGGCLWQNLPYEIQVEVKRDLVWECLAHIAGLGEDLVRPTLPSPRQYYYRNKMEFSFGPRRWLLPGELGLEQLEKPRDFALGLHVRGFYDRVLDIDECHLQSPGSVAVVEVVRRFALGSGLAPYNTRDHTGFWRFLVVRDSKRGGGMLVELLTAPHPGAAAVASQLGAILSREIPEVTTLVHGISGRKAQVARADRKQVLLGPGYIEEQLGGLRFRISPTSFFQTNTLGAEVLMDELMEACALTGSETVWDLYCGTGSITIKLAGAAERAVGLELEPEAVADARNNAGLNGTDNCEFILGDIKTLLAGGNDLINRYGKPRVVVTDPPRAGMHPRAVESLLEVGPSRIVYVSCNPATLARDLKTLLRDYRLVRVRPVDLFPHTAHIEAVVLLERR
jgi:23S rRNA (uracil1939-C5)-methyltransferase